MIKAEKPSYDIKKVIDDCLPKRSTDENFAERQSRITEYKESIITESIDYDLKATTADLYKIHRIEDNTAAKQIKDDMNYMYGTRFRDENCGSYYSSIRFGAKFCPYCGKRFSTTTAELDHFLPRSYYPFLSITPVNLVPACRECNKFKHGTPLLSSNEQFFHPYYEDLSKEVWIKAEVIHDSQAERIGFIFKVDCPADWSVAKRTRAMNQFVKLDLARRYPIMMGESFSVFLQKVKRFYRQNGIDDGKTLAKADATEDIADKDHIFHKNHYHLVILRALLADDWFWDVFIPTQVKKEKIL